MAWLAPRSGNRQTRDRHRLAPQGVQAFLDMEVAAGKAGPTTGVEGDPCSGRRMSRENTYLIGSDIGLMMAALSGSGWPRGETCQQFCAAESYWDALSLASPPPHLGPFLHPPDASRKRSAAPPCTIATAKSVRRTQSAKPPFTTSMANSVRHRPSGNTTVHNLGNKLGTSHTVGTTTMHNCDGKFGWSQRFGNIVVHSGALFTDR